MSQEVKRFRTAWWQSLMNGTGLLLVSSAIPSTVFLGVTLSGRLAFEPSETLLFGGYLAGLGLLIGFVLLFIAERITARRICDTEPVSYSKKYRKIARLAMVLASLFLAIFWIQKVLDSGHSDGWGILIVEYLTICLIALGLLLIRFRSIAKWPLKSPALLCANVGCWLLIIPFVASCVLYGIYLRSIWGTMTDLNDYFDPLVFILNYITPLGCYGVGGLFLLRHYGFTRGRYLASAIALFSILTLVLLSFGLLIFRGLEDPFRLSHFVWWFAPFRAFGL